MMSGKEGRERKRRKKHRIPLVGRILIIFVVIVTVFLGFSYGMIRHFTGDSLGMKGVLAMAGYGGFDMPDGFRRFVLSGDRSYAGTPELLLLSDGTEVNTIDAYEKRRKELLADYETYMYGKIPREGFETSFSEEETGEALDGKAVRRQIKITVTTDQGSCEAMLLVYLPADAKACGVFLGENFSGNTTVWNDPEILPSIAEKDDAERGSDSSWPVADIIDRGYGVATMYYGDWAEDNMETYRDALLHLFDDTDTTAFGAWAFGIMRGVDYLTTLEEIDKSAIATVGHSRLARVSLWAGANDDRISLVTASCGGGYMRSPVMGKITTKSTSNHWFTPSYFDYEGRDEEFPTDMNALFALAADRHLYISAGQNDLASDPIGMFDALQDAKEVWSRIYGREVIDDMDFYDITSEEPLFSEGVAFHVHQGGHLLDAEDWMKYMDYMEQYIK